ncbi:hypothetical protein ACVWWO_009530 [Bradyrhizobium sp. F1.13.1]
MLQLQVRGTDLGISEFQTKPAPRVFKHNVRIEHQKFSIHPSAESATHNQLHFHQILADGEKRDVYHVTNAISGNRFAPLFIKRYSNLRDPIYSLKQGGNAINLGSYDTGWFSLILCVLVAHTDRRFTARSHDISVLQHRFQNFSLILLWSFFVLPATNFSMLSGFMTLRPEDAADVRERVFRENLMSGWDDQDAISNFSLIRDGLRDEGIQTAMRFVPEAFEQNPSAVALAECRYFRSGEYTNKVIKALKARFRGMTCLTV